MADWSHWPTCVAEDARFVFTRTDPSSDQDLPSLPPNASDQTIIHGFIKCLIYYHGILYSHRKSSAVRGPCWWNLLVLPCSPSSWSIWLDRTVEWLFEDSVMVPTRWLAGMKQGSPEGYLCSKSASPIYGGVSPIGRIHGGRDQNLEMGVGPLTIIPRDLKDV